MSDFLEPSSLDSYRTALYDKYVSAFKSENASLSESELSHFFAWCDARYYPILKSLPKSVAILELGCGHGRMLAYLRKKGFTNVSGIDISEEQIKIAQKAGLNAERADVFELLKSFNSQFDCIIAIDFVEHFTKSELLLLFEFIHNALLSNGIILIQTVNGEGLFPNQIARGDLTHETILSPGSLTQLLSLTGFRDVQFFETAPLASGLKGMIRSLAWSWIRFSANVIRKIEAGKYQQIWTENLICTAKKVD